MYLTQPLRMRRDYGEKEMIDTKEMEETLEESRKTGNTLLDEYVLFDDDILSKLASEDTELVEALEEEAAVVMPAQGWKVGDDEGTHEDEKEARHEEGKSVDPTEDMSEEDKKKWKEMTEKNKDKFKAKSAAIKPEAWAKANKLDVEYDNDGQKIIYLTKKQADQLSFPKGVDWDAQKEGQQWVIYTGDFDRSKKKATHSITAHDLAKIDSGRSKAASEGAYADRLFTVANLLKLSKNEKRARIALGEVSDVLDLYGVETAEKEGQRALFINAGDNNRPTIVYSVDNGRMVIASANALFKSGFEQEESNVKLATRFSLPSKRAGHTVDFGIDRSFGRFFQLVAKDGEAVVDKDRLNQGTITGLLKKYGKDSSELDKAISAFMLDLDPQDMGLKYAKEADPKKVRLAELRELRTLRKEAEEVAKVGGGPMSVGDWIAWED